MLQCQVLLERQDLLSKPDNVPLLAVPSGKNDGDITYERLVAEAVDCVWGTDLHGLPPFNFVQLYDYLVLKTAKYNLCQGIKS